MPPVLAGMTTNLLGAACWWEILHDSRRTSARPGIIRAVTWLPGEPCARYIVEDPCGVLFHLTPGVSRNEGRTIETVYIGEMLDGAVP